MKLYIRQHVFTWGDKFDVCDEYGGARYYVYGDVFTWGKKLHITDGFDRELYYISQRILTWMPAYELYRGGGDGVFAGTVHKNFTFFFCRYTVDGLGWTVEGDFTDHEYSITDGAGNIVATVSKQWFTWGDTYEIAIDERYDMQELDVLAVVLCVDAACHSE